jgi:hypothetical protein
MRAYVEHSGVRYCGVIFGGGVHLTPEFHRLICTATKSEHRHGMWRRDFFPFIFCRAGAELVIKEV